MEVLACHPVMAWNFSTLKRPISAMYKFLLSLSISWCDMSNADWAQKCRIVFRIEVLISMVQALLYGNKKNRKKFKLLKNIKFWSRYNIFNVPFLSANLQKYPFKYEIYITITYETEWYGRLWTILEIDTLHLYYLKKTPFYL